MQDDEEKVVVEESFKAETSTGTEPLEEPNMSSSSTSAFETWIIKLEQGVNVFLTVRFYNSFIYLKRYVLLEI